MKLGGINRIWLFFVVVAVALVWSWSQVGQHQTASIRLKGEEIRLLRTERGCDLAKGPCAAYLADLAVVAAAKAEGDGVRWRVSLVGEGVPEVPVVAMLLLPPKGSALQLAVLQSGDEWRADSPRRVAPGSILRVRIEGGPLPLIADFSLRGGDR